MAWNDTQQGSDLAAAFRRMRDTYTVVVPSQINQINGLATRGIRG